MNHRLLVVVIGILLGCIAAGLIYLVADISFTGTY